MVWLLLEVVGVFLGDRPRDTREVETEEMREEEVNLPRVLEKCMQPLVLSFLVEHEKVTDLGNVELQIIPPHVFRRQVRIYSTQAARMQGRTSDKASKMDARSYLALLRS